jgi:phospholipid-transporting ATPase
MCCLQISTDLSPTNKYATIAPLFLVLAVTIFKELIEDIQRHKADDVVNSSRTLVLRGSDFVEIAWAEVTVGDIVCVYNKQSVPADLIIISSSDEHGVVYIETSGLDG